MIKRDKRIKVMREMLDLLKQQGYERASLAVQKANYAVRMYETVGFQNVGENEEEFIMVNTEKRLGCRTIPL